MIKFSIKTLVLFCLLFSKITGFSQCWQKISGGTLHNFTTKKDGTL
jgi:hypothetical protein